MTIVSRAAIISAISLPSQGKLTTEPTKAIVVGTGDGVATDFETPFIYSTALKGFVNDVTAPLTLIRGRGELDYAKFTTAPASGTTVTVSADSEAINTIVLDMALEDADRIIRGAAQSGGYQWPLNSGSADVARPYASGLVKWLLRSRRGIEDNADIPGWIDGWLRAIARREEFFPMGAPIDVVSVSSSDTLAYGSEESLFLGVAPL